MCSKCVLNILLVGAIMLAAIGCSGSTEMKYTTAKIQGTVSYQGKPLESGKIRFIPDGKVVNGQVAGKAVFADIKDGKYSLSSEEGATVGKNRIEIKSYRESGRNVVTSEGDGKKEKEIVQFIPETYNTESNLSINIKEGENKHDFDLQ
ncbi:hypothetical protein [Gimesia aquarii]|uniref:Carboxypeptidase regulatory-like domain-containing protein n=1 Tax=Gimesia aquarii TaxID=2527964 RepID=A0A517W114_9PLAN|nr:hypothetical protein [Gimesia aquarii]QDT98941.1 hypothetical protein V144x_44510 [Gimesia aquarii]